jgi:hypothetical protein
VGFSPRRRADRPSAAWTRQEDDVTTNRGTASRASSQPKGTGPGAPPPGAAAGPGAAAPLPEPYALLWRLPLVVLRRNLEMQAVILRAYQRALAEVRVDASVDEVGRQAVKAFMAGSLELMKVMPEIREQLRAAQPEIVQAYLDLVDDLARRLPEQPA